VTELLAAATLDMNWHTVSNEADFKPTLVLKTSTRKYGLLVNEVPTRYHTLILRTFVRAAILLVIMRISKHLIIMFDWMKANGGLTK
jgi:peptidyl-dipeptidase Dcp